MIAEYVQAQHSLICFTPPPVSLSQNDTPPRWQMPTNLLLLHGYPSTPTLRQPSFFSPLLSSMSRTRATDFNISVVACTCCVLLEIFPKSHTHALWRFMMHLAYYFRYCIHHLLWLLLATEVSGIVILLCCFIGVCLKSFVFFSFSSLCFLFILFSTSLLHSWCRPRDHAIHPSDYPLHNRYLSVCVRHWRFVFISLTPRRKRDRYMESEWATDVRVNIFDSIVLQHWRWGKQLWYIYIDATIKWLWKIESQTKPFSFSFYFSFLFLFLLVILQLVWYSFSLSVY